MLTVILATGEWLIIFFSEVSELCQRRNHFHANAEKGNMQNAGLTRRDPRHTKHISDAAIALALMFDYIPDSKTQELRPIFPLAFPTFCSTPELATLLATGKQG